MPVKFGNVPSSRTLALAFSQSVMHVNPLGAAPLLEQRVTQGILAQVQKRREFPVRVTQWLQTRAHNGMSALFQNPGPFQPPWQLRVALAIPGVQHLIGRMVGMGIRPEYIKPERIKEPKKAAS